jgi:hypothetical protein
MRGLEVRWEIAICRDAGRAGVYVIWGGERLRADWSR